MCLAYMFTEHSPFLIGEDAQYLLFIKNKIKTAIYHHI